MAHLQESGRLSRSRCRLWIMSLVASSYARNQNMGRCDLSTWSQIPMAHRQKQFQVKSLAKHWNSISSLRSRISKRTKIKKVHVLLKPQNPNGTLAGEWKTFTKSLQTLNYVPSLHLAMPGIRKWEGATCQLGVKSQWHTAKSNSRSKA